MASSTTGISGRDYNVVGTQNQNPTIKLTTGNNGRGSGQYGRRGGGDHQGRGGRGGHLNQMPNMS